ncbi:hypothetical protein GA0070560_12289 [Micromonospora halophytica]|uniref:Uncharacterized protein n=1 Tax=Micromonospora halophytica TaxID=47864 RepID=A0A1C5J680_9ACTN|nr:hypothetical protein GA0070560_12289 [Micromonospora halophytica]
MAAHATLAQLMYAGLVDAAAPGAQLRVAATLMYYVGDLVEILLALALLVTWRPSPARTTPVTHRRPAPAPARPPSPARNFTDVVAIGGRMATRPCLLDHGLGRSGFARSQMRMSAICTVAR